MTDPLTKHDAPYCSICSGLEPACSDGAEAVICSGCNVKGAVKAQESTKKCPGCGKKIAGDLKQCPACERKADLSATMRSRAKRYRREAKP